MLSGFLGPLNPGWAQLQTVEVLGLGSSMREKLPAALGDVGSIWPLSAATRSSLLCVCNWLPHIPESSCAGK